MDLKQTEAILNMVSAMQSLGKMAESMRSMVMKQQKQLNILDKRLIKLETERDHYKSMLLKN